MRNSNNKKNCSAKEKKMHILPKSLVLSILLLVTFFIEGVFILLLAVLDVLPGIFMTVILILLAAVTAIIWILLNSRKKKTRQRKIGVVLSSILVLIFIFGSYYLINTYDTFNKISSEGKLMEDFHVVVLKDEGYEKVNDIKGKKVFVTGNRSDSYKEAKGRLLSKVDISYNETKTDYLETGHQLIEDRGKRHDNVIFVSNANYEMLCEDIDGFKEQTKILYTISIEIGSGDIAKRIDVTEASFNVYISGIDTFGSINKVARSDVNMIMTVNPKTKQILLTSVPRDMYVSLHSYGAKDKLTHSGIYGIRETTTTVEDWLDIDINYYIRVNFTTLVDIVDVIDGIDVVSEYDFVSSVLDYSYVKGVNHLSGEAALYFARERKSFSGGDNERVLNQQRVLKGIIKKITGSTVILTKYTQLLNAVEDEMQTNLSNKDISALVKMQLDDLGGWNIESNSVKGKGTYAATYSMGSRELYVAIPIKKSVIAAKNKIDKVIYSER